MQSLNLNVFSIIASYLPDASLVVLTEIIPSDMSAIAEETMFWKYKVETLLGRHLEIRAINWKRTYYHLIEIEEKQNYYPRDVTGKLAKAAYDGYTDIVD